MIWIAHFVIVNSLLLVSKLKNDDKFFIRSSFLYGIFVFGQRWMTGTDFPYYLQYYMLDFKAVEPGYYLIQKILTEFSLYFGILIFIVFVITLYNNYRFIIKIDKHVILIIYLYLFSEIFFAQMSQIRQFLAVSFFLNSFFYSYNNKYWKSGINILFGLLFHESIIFFIPFLFFKIKLDKVKLLYFLCLSAVLPLVDISLFLRLPLFSRYSGYVDSIFNVNLSLFHYVKFYIILAIILVFVWYIKHFGKSKVEQMILNGLVWDILLYGMSFQFAIMLRMSMYFKIFEIIFLIYYFNKVKGFSYVFLKVALTTLFLGIFSGLAVTDPYNVSEYQFSPLRLHETRTSEQLRVEIRTFLDR